MVNIVRSSPRRGAEAADASTHSTHCGSVCEWGAANKVIIEVEAQPGPEKG